MFFLGFFWGGSGDAKPEKNLPKKPLKNPEVFLGFFLGPEGFFRVLPFGKDLPGRIAECVLS